MILEKGHGKAVDYWAFGVLFFEMLNGHSPFEAEDHLATYQKILDGTVNYPTKMNAQALKYSPRPPSNAGNPSNAGKNPPSLALGTFCFKLFAPDPRRLTSLASCCRKIFLGDLAI